MRKDPDEAVALLTQGSLQSIREHLAISLMVDITRYFGLVRVVLLLYGGAPKVG